jgi:hypothetical protein
MTRIESRARETLASASLTKFSRLIDKSLDLSSSGCKNYTDYLTILQTVSKGSVK